MMAPIMLLRDWLAAHPSYAALDEYLRWAQSRQGGQIHLHPKTGKITYRKDPTSGKVLPTTVYRNILDHLDHVFTKVGTGPSVLTLILEMLPDSAIKNLRRVTKSIGTAATKAYCKSIRLPTDSFTDNKGLSSRTLSKFIAAFTNSARRVSVDPNSKLPPWLMNTDYVKELYFYQDPVNEEKLVKLFTNFAQQLEANGIWNHDIAIRAAVQDGKELIEYPRTSTFQDDWYQILLFIEHCPNLEVFTWKSHVWQPVELLQVLAFNCPKLAKIDLNFSELLLEPGGLHKSSTLPQLKHKSASGFEQVTYTLPLNLEIHLRIAVKRDEYVLPILLHLGAFTSQVDTLIIDRSFSEDGYSAENQGWNTESPLLVDNKPVQLATCSLFEVRSLSMISIGNKSRYIMPLLDTTGLRELIIVGCLNLEFLLQPLVRHAKYLTSVAMIFPVDHAEYVERPLRYHHLQVQDRRYALDFVRAGNFTLTDLLLHGDFADSARTPKSYSLLVPDLWFAIQAHMATLVRLSVLNHQDDFRVTDIEELGRCAPHLQELRIQARLGFPEYGMPTPRSEGLAYSLKRALLAFRTYKTLRVLAIMKSFASFHPDEDPEHSKFVMNNNLNAVVNAINHEVPIKLFTFMEEPLHQPPTSHFFYNKTPFEPDVTWGIYPSPPPPSRKDAQYFKGFEFHETILGQRGGCFYAQAGDMLARHEQLVKELQLWHPETKRGGGTFSPERLKLPSDTVRMIQQPTPPETYVGDFGDPRWREKDATVLSERFAGASGALTRGTGRQLATSHGNRAPDWSVAKNPNAKKYYVSKRVRKASWNNPIKINVSRGKKMLRISEEDRNELFGKDLPSYEPLTLSESEFNAMTGRDLYLWEDLYSVLDQASIAKLEILESPTTIANRNAQYAVLHEYAPQNQSWDIDNPYNFVLAKYALCARQRKFILKAAIIKKIVIPEPITEEKFWAKSLNDQLVWLHLNGFVNNVKYPLLTLEYALQPMPIIKTPLVDNVEADEAYTQLIAFLDDVHSTHIKHARKTGKILANPISEEAFNKIADSSLYIWAVLRRLIPSISYAEQRLTDQVGLQYVELFAHTYRGEILNKAVQKGQVTLQVSPEKEIREIAGGTLSHWAVSRNLLPSLPLANKLALELVAIGDRKKEIAMEKRENIVQAGIRAGYITASPIVRRAVLIMSSRPTRIRNRHPTTLAAEGELILASRIGPPGSTMEGNVEDETKGRRTTQARRVAFVDSDRTPLPSRDTQTSNLVDDADMESELDLEDEELRSLSKDGLVLKVMALCTGSDLMKQLGMRGLLDAVSRCDKSELIDILLKSTRADEEEEEEY